MQLTAPKAPTVVTAAASSKTEPSRTASTTNTHHQVDVLRKPGRTVKCEGVAADQQKINFPREAQFDELSDVLV